MDIDDNTVRLSLTPEECDFARTARRMGLSYIDIADTITTDVENPTHLIPYVTEDIHTDAYYPPFEQDIIFTDEDLLLYLFEYEELRYSEVAQLLDCNPESISEYDPRDMVDISRTSRPLIAQLQRMESPISKASDEDESKNTTSLSDFITLD